MTEKEKDYNYLLDYCNELAERINLLSAVIDQCGKNIVLIAKHLGVIKENEELKKIVN